jgi:hypothetical protein
MILLAAYLLPAAGITAILAHDARFSPSRWRDLSSAAAMGLSWPVWTAALVPMLAGVGAVELVAWLEWRRRV